MLQYFSARFLSQQQPNAVKEFENLFWMLPNCSSWNKNVTFVRRNLPEVFLVKAFLKICSKFIGEHLCRTAISIKLKATLLKLHFGMGVLQYIRCIFSEHLFIRTSLDGCFCFVCFACKDEWNY